MKHIDHLVYAAPNLDSAIDDLEERFGVRATLGGQHPAFGTKNALMSLGTDVYLEIIAPISAKEKPTVLASTHSARRAWLPGWLNQTISRRCRNCKHLWRRSGKNIRRQAPTNGRFIAVMAIDRSIHPPRRRFNSILD
jgi:hypothetical protein